MKRTSMYLKVCAAALALVIVVGSCKDDEQLPAIDGYNTADDVASSSLLAHWSFDNDQKESKSGTAPSNTYGTVSSGTGQVGNALVLNGGALVYPSIDALNSANALNNFSVSVWVNVTGRKGVANSGYGYQEFFGLIPTTTTDVWGDINVGAEAGQHLPSSDTLVLKALLRTHPVTGADTQDNISGTNGDIGQHFLGAKKWVHFVATWEASTHKFNLYGNGTAVGAYNDRGATAALIMAVPVKPVFGSVAAADIGFTAAGARPAEWPMANCMVDEVRVYNNVLTQAEITALFNFGTAGR
ncbi:MAG: LamG-like jellyroll fold domain-containing protein [Bacteroidota bacterium]